MSEARPLYTSSNATDFAQQINDMLQDIQDKFQSTSNQMISRIDETGRSLDVLEKTIAELMTEAGVDA